MNDFFIFNKNEISTFYHYSLSMRKIIILLGFKMLINKIFLFSVSKTFMTLFDVYLRIEYNFNFLRMGEEKNLKPITTIFFNNTYFVHRLH